MADKDKSIWREILRGSVVDFFKRPLVWVYMLVVLLIGSGIWAAYGYLNAIAIHTTAFWAVVVPSVGFLLGGVLVFGIMWWLRRRADDQLESYERDVVDGLIIDWTPPWWVAKSNRDIDILCPRCLMELVHNGELVHGYPIFHVSCSSCHFDKRFKGRFDLWLDRVIREIDVRIRRGEYRGAKARIEALMLSTRAKHPS